MEGIAAFFIGLVTAVFSLPVDIPRSILGDSQGIQQLQQTQATTSPYAAVTTVGQKPLYLLSPATTTALGISGLDCTTFTNGGALTTDADGNVSCSNDDGGGSSSFPFTPTTHYGTTTNATGTPLFLRGSPIALIASSTSIFDNASTSLLSIADRLYIGGDEITDFVGAGLTLSGTTLTTSLGTSVTVGELASADFGDWTCNGAACSLDADTVSDSEIDYSTITLADFSNDAGLESVLSFVWPLSRSVNTISWAGLSTTTNLTTGRVVYSSGVGSITDVATSSVTLSSPLTSSGTPGYVVGGSSWAIGVDTSGAWTGNAGTATALAANGANCSSGSAPLGVDASGASESCFDVWTQAENTAAAYGTGSVTSVAMTVPTGLSIAGSPITTTGTLALTYTSGYAGVLTASTTNWNSFYDLPSGVIAAGDALTWSGSTINFDGGALPSGDLGGTWASPSVTDDSHAHTSTTLSGIDISADTNLAVGYPIILTDDTLSLAFGTTTTNTWSNLQTFTSGLVSQSVLGIPNGTGPTVDAVGEVALDTTDMQLLVGTTTANTPRVIPTVQKLWGRTVASTSVDFVSGGRMPLPPNRDGVTMLEFHCFVDGGTSVVLNLDTLAGGVNTDTITCDADGASDTDIATNPTLTAGALPALEFGTVTGAVDYVTISVWGIITRE